MRDHRPWFIALGLVALMVASCAPSQPQTRQLSQHHSGAFNTITEVGDQGMVLWKCHQVDGDTICDAICADGYFDDRVCAPELHGEFGVVSRSLHRRDRSTATQGEVAP